MFKRVTIGEINFNDDALNNNFYITDFAGLETPPIRYSSFNVPGDHYGVFVSAYYGERAFTLKGVVRADNEDDFKTKLDLLQKEFSILNGSREITFKLVNDAEVSLDAVLVDFQLSPTIGSVNLIDFSAQFKASFPFLVSSVENEDDIFLSLGGGGECPSDCPMELPDIAGSELLVQNNGNAIYYPKFVINGPVVNPSIKSNTQNATLRLVLTLAAGESITIDTKEKTIIDNSGVSRYSAKTGKWFYIGPGENSLSFLADTFNPTGFVAVKYRDSYLGI